MKYDFYDDFDVLCDVVVDKLEENKIIGWFQGKSEYGPRALGNRSILADSRNLKMKDFVNKKVKHRENYRKLVKEIKEARRYRFGI